MTPLQLGAGAARKLNLWPTTGWKSLSISHSLSSAPCVSARQIFRADDAALSRSRACASPSLIHPFEQVFETIELLAPEGGVETHPVDQRCEGFRLRAVMRFAAVPPVAHKSGVFEDTQMFRHGGLGDIRIIRQHPHGLFAFAAQPSVNRPAGRIGKGFEKQV